MNRERQIKKEGGRGNRKQWGGEEEEIGKNERDRKKEWRERLKEGDEVRNGLQ